MRYFRIIITFLLVGMCSVLRAQSLSVESFRLLETDLTANTYGTSERDQNGEVAALIKVVTSETGFVFDGGMMGIVKTVQKTGEIWVYVPRAIQKITITHQQYGVLRDYYFPINIDRARTYEMVLKLPYTAPVSSRTRAQYVVFNVEPHNAVVLVDNEAHTLNSEGQLSLRLNPGEHSYMVTAPSFETETGTVTVRDSRVTKSIKLSSLVGRLTISTDDDAQVFIDDEFMGYGTWSGQLNEGVYFVEVRRPSYRNAYQEVSLRRSDNRNVSVRAIEPAYGDVEVVSDPLDFDIYIDGEKLGTTPDYITFVRAGTHTVTLKKPEYFDRELTVEVFEDSVAYISVSDFERIPESAKDKKRREAAEAKAAKEAAKAEAKAAKQAERDAARYAEQTAQETDDEERPAQNADNIELFDPAELGDVFTAADVMPVFPKGSAALIQFFKDNVVCPQYYRGNDRVVVAFIVEKDGSVSSPTIVKGIDDVIDKEVLRVMDIMPRWTPGMNDGRIVRVMQTVNINIRNKGTTSAFMSETGTNSAPASTRKVKQKSHYVGGFYNYSSLAEYGVAAGLYNNHFNLELSYGFHNKVMNGIWPPTEKPLFNGGYDFTRKYDYSWKYDCTIGARIGVGMNIGRTLRITPQAGVVMTRMRCVDDELMMWFLKRPPSTYTLGGQAAAKFELRVMNHMSLFATASYTYPFLMDEVAGLLEDNNKSVRPDVGGFKVGAGLNIVF